MSEPLRRQCRVCGNFEIRRKSRFATGTAGSLREGRAASWPCECEQPDWYQESKDWEVGYGQGFAAALDAMTSDAALAEAKWWQGKDAVEAAVEAVKKEAKHE